MIRTRRSAAWGGRGDPPASWMGRDRRRARRPAAVERPVLAALLVGLLLAGLALAALRIDVIRVRYALNAANDREEVLKEERAELVVRVRQLRHPERLATEARRMGLERPDRVIQLSAHPETR